MCKKKTAKLCVKNVMYACIHKVASFILKCVLYQVIKRPQIKTTEWALKHHTGEQYSAAEWTKARVEVRNVVAPETQVDSVSCFQTQHVLLIFCSMTQVSAKLEHSIQFYAEVYRLGTVR